MRSGVEQQRGNQFFDFSFQYPFEQTDVVKYKSGPGMLSVTQKCGNFLFCFKIGYTTCYDFNMRKVIWEFEESGTRFFPRVYENELYMWAEERWLAKVCPEDGDFVWRFDVDEEIRLVTENRLLTYAYDPQSNSGPLLMRSKFDGGILWSYEGGGYGHYGNMLCENGILIVKSQEGCHAFDEDTGELLWKFRSDEWQQKYLRGLPESRSVMLRLFVNGIFYLSLDQGLLAAVNAESGELHWLHKVQKPKFLADTSTLVQPMAVIRRNGEVFFTINQGRGHLNYLTVLDAETGKQVYQSDNNITPSGCQNPVIAGKYFVGAYDRHLSVFDVDKKEFVWLYEYPKPLDLFGGPMALFEGGLVVGHPETNSMYWFRSPDK